MKTITRGFVFVFVCFVMVTFLQIVNWTLPVPEPPTRGRMKVADPTPRKRVQQSRRLPAQEPAKPKPNPQVIKEAPKPVVRHVESRQKEPVVVKKRAPVVNAAPASSGKDDWVLHVGKTCQGYANNDHLPRKLEDAKAACIANDACVALECPTGSANSCTLRANANLVPYKPVDCYTVTKHHEHVSVDGKRKIALHPEYHNMLKHYPFQSVRTNTGKTVNIMLVRSAPNDMQLRLIDNLKDEILFIGISSFEDFPKPSVNPFSAKYPADKYVGRFPGFLHMLRPEDAAKTFPPHVKLLLMSQSDFNLPNHAYRDYSVPKKYDFTYSGSDQDVRNDCVGWSSFAKNWSFVKEALEVMCGEFKLKGVLVATIDKQNVKSCTIPKSCEGLITKTQYIPQNEFLHYVEQSKFLFLPQIHDASPRVSSQALSLDVPLLMNAYISGGWKYLNDKTGEFFHDLSDFRESLRRLLKNSEIEKHYEPRKWVTERYGNPHSCKKLYDWVVESFPDWAETVLPPGTNCLLI